MADYTSPWKNREIGNVPLNRDEEMMDSSEMITAAEQAAREVDSERREVDEVIEQMRNRQRYFYEKAQMFSEAADHYKRMSEDIAELLNNPYIENGQKEAMG